MHERLTTAVGPTARPAVLQRPSPPDFSNAPMSVIWNAFTSAVGTISSSEASAAILLSTSWSARFFRTSGISCPTPLPFTAGFCATSGVATGAAAGACTVGVLWFVSTACVVGAAGGVMSLETSIPSITVGPPASILSSWLACSICAWIASRSPGSNCRVRPVDGPK